MKIFGIHLGLVAVWVSLAMPAWAKPAELVESFDWLRAAVHVRYAVEQTSSNIEREYKCSGDPNRCPTAPEVVTVSELQATRSRHSMWMDGRLGSESLQVQVAVPYVLQDIRRVSFADEVSILNTTLFETVGDEKVELLNQANAPNRRGLGDLTLGLHATFLSMERREAMPDFKARAQYTAPTAPVMRATNLAVGEGLHQVLVGLEAGYGQAVQAHLDLSAKLRFAADDELYLTGFRTQNLQHPGAQARAATTLTFTPWSTGSASRFLTVSVGGDLLFTAAGREPTVLFDALAGSRCTMLPECEATNYFVPASSGLDSRGSAINGVTDVQEHLRMGGKVELRYRPASNIEIFAGVNLAFTPAHFLTFARIGMDVDNNGVLEDVDQTYQQSEYNPVYVEALDKGGSRLIASGTFHFSGFLSTAYLY